MQLYDLICDAVRHEEIRRRPLADNTNCEVHFRATGSDGAPEIVVSRHRIDRPERISERVYHVDDVLD